MGGVVAGEPVYVSWHGEHEKHDYFGSELIETVGFVLGFHTLGDMYFCS